MASTSWSGTDAHLQAPDIAIADFADRFTYAIQSEPPVSAKSHERVVLPGKKQGRRIPVEPESAIVELPYELVFSPAQAPHIPSRRELCKRAASVAAAHNLPVPFFANLIWQESGFQSDVVSHAGAQGIAQFMPQTATAYGLEDPFDPIPSLQASGKLLSDLRAQFGNNLGLVAAAYNAGPKRVLDWMARRRKLPSETRNYVQSITGRPAEHWASAKVNGEHMMPRHAPCLEVALALESQAKMQPVQIVASKRVTTRVTATVRRTAVPVTRKTSLANALRNSPKKTLVLASAKARKAGARRPLSIKPVAVGAKQLRPTTVKVKLASPAKVKLAATRKPAPIVHASKPAVGKSKKVKVATVR